MFQKQVLNLGSVFPFCYFLLLAHCNFPFVYKQFMSVSSVETELSRSAWSTFSWCKDCSLGCRNIKNEVDFTMPRKSPCKLLPEPKRPPNNRSFKKPHVFSLYSRAVQQSKGLGIPNLAQTPDMLLVRMIELRAELPSILSLSTGAPGTKRSWSYPPYPSAKSTLTLFLLLFHESYLNPWSFLIVVLQREKMEGDMS